MINTLPSFSTPQQIWDLLQRFQLEVKIANYKQGNLSILEYYSKFLNLWTNHSAILYVSVPNIHSWQSKMSIISKINFLEVFSK